MGNPTREGLVFALVLGTCVTAFFHEALLGGKVLSPADALLVSASFRQEGEADYEPANRLLMDPVLQFQPWLDFNRRMVRSGRYPHFTETVLAGLGPVDVSAEFDIGLEAMLAGLGARFGI